MRPSYRNQPSAIQWIYHWMTQQHFIFQWALSALGLTHPTDHEVHMPQIAATPTPPYYAVIAPAVLADDLSGYPAMAKRLLEVAQEIDGFIGIETSSQGNFIIAVSYWHSLEAIERWRQHPAHQEAKRNGKARWFQQYTTRIARVEQAY
jgi:heme-degrading monooxygenase HmoA